MTHALRVAEHPLVNALGWSLLHFVWQGAVIGLAAYLVLRLVRPAAASTRYGLAVGALLILFFAPIITFMTLADRVSPAARLSSTLSRPGITSASLVTGSIVADMAANPTAARQLIAPSSGSPRVDAAIPRTPIWLPVVTAIWLAGVTLLSVRLLGGWMLTRLLARRAVVRVSPMIDAAAREIARRLELQRAVAILESAAISVPTLIGWVRPVVLLPAAALAGLSPQQLEAVLAHELAHVRRHDYLINLLQSAVETLLFYHPAVWWVSAEIRAERENCCDDLAVAVCGDRLVYVSALAELTALERRAFALAVTDGSIVTRIRRILGRPMASRRELPPSWGILALVALLAGGAGTYEISTAAADLTASSRTEESKPVATAPGQGVAEAFAPFAILQEPPVPPVPPLPPVPPVPPLPPDAPDSPAAPATPVPPAPPTAPAAPTPPAPPVPPVPPVASDGQGSLSWSRDGERLAVKWTGPFRLSDDERDIGWIEEGARLTITDGRVFTDRVELRGIAGGGIEREFFRRGVKRDYELEGRAFLANAIGRMIRSGMFASERVARFLKQGGPEAVLAEVDRLQSDSSYLKRAYYSALLKQAELTPAVLTRLLERVSKDISSDYDKATVLVQILAEESITEDQRVAVARAVASVGSDYEQRKVLIAALTTAAVSEPMAAAAIAAASSIRSAYDRGLVLGELARRGAVTAHSSAPFMAAVSGMSSGYEQRKVLSALAAAPALPEQVASDAAKAAAAISSSHDKAEVLLELIRTAGLDDQSAAALFAAATTIRSSYDLARVLRAVGLRPNLTDVQMNGLLRAAASVGSSHDRATLLLDLLKAQALSASARQLFFEVAQGISSSHEQNRVLAELARSERRER